MSPTMTTVPTDDGLAMPAHLWLPESGTGPGIVLFQEIFGVSAYIQRRAQDLASLGYVVLVPEAYWRLEDRGPFEGPDALGVAFGAMQAIDWQQAVLDGASAVQSLRGNDSVDGPVGIVGFCFGGGLGFNVAAHLESELGGGTPVDGLVSYYGSALPGLVDVMTVTAPSLHHFGLADSYIDVPTVRRIEEIVTAQPDTTFITYEGADHAFDNSDFVGFNAAASELSWERTTERLAEHLPTDRNDSR